MDNERLAAFWRSEVIGIGSDILAELMVTPIPNAMTAVASAGASGFGIGFEMGLKLAVRDIAMARRILAMIQTELPDGPDSPQAQAEVEAALDRWAKAAR